MKSLGMRALAWLAIGVGIGSIYAFPAGAQSPSVAQLSAELKGSDAKKQLAAVHALADLGPSAASAAPALVEALKADDAHVRAHAIRALVAVGAPAEIVKPAASKLLKDSDADVRAQAAYTLGQYRPADQATVQALAEGLIDKSPNVRRASMRAIRNLVVDKKVVVPIVLKVLEDEDPAVVLPALHTLAEGGEAVVPGLIKALENPKARYWAAVVITEIGPDAKDAVPALIKVLGDEQPETRMQAAVALGEIGEASKPAVPALLKALTDKQPSVKYGAAFALGQIADPSAAKALAEADVKDDPFFDMITTWAAAKSNPADKELTEQAVKELIAGLTAKESFMRQAAARGLLELKAPQEVVAPALTKLLKDSDPEVVAEVVAALASLGPKIVPNAAQALKKSETPEVAARILAQIGPAAKDAVPALAEAVGSDNAALQRESAIALARIGKGAAPAVDALAKAVDADDRQVSLAAIYALGSIGPDAKSAVPTLVKQLKDEDFLARASAAWALVEIQPENKETTGVAVPLLAEALSHEHEMVRVHAADALGELGPDGRDAVSALQAAAQKDKSAAVRNAAAAALRKMTRQ